MPLLKRIGFYLLGFSVGVVFLAFFFKEKRTEFCYMPNCRVLKELRSKEIEIAPGIKNITKEELTAIFTNGDVLFSKSEVHTSPCKTYVVKGVLKEQEIEVTAKYCPEKVIVEAIHILENQ